MATELESTEHLYDRDNGYIGPSSRYGGDDDDRWDSTFEHDGSDLYIADPATLLREIEAHLESIARKAERGSLQLQDIDPKILEDAQFIKDEFERRYQEMSEKDKAYAKAIQDWTIEELRVREDKRGEVFPQGSQDSYLETIEVLDALIAELSVDGEDDRLVEFAQVWRTETIAELDIAKVRDLYRLAA